MKRYFFISLLVLIAFSGLTIYRIKTKPKLISQVPQESKQCAPYAGIECINGKRATAKEVMVTFDKSVTPEQVANLLKNLDVGKYYKITDINDYDISSKHTSTSTLIEQFSKLKEVISVKPLYLMYID